MKKHKIKFGIMLIECELNDIKLLKSAERKDKKRKKNM